MMSSDFANETFIPHRKDFCCNHKNIPQNIGVFICFPAVKQTSPAYCIKPRISLYLMRYGNCLSYSCNRSSCFRGRRMCCTLSARAYLGLCCVLLSNPHCKLSFRFNICDLRLDYTYCHHCRFNYPSIRS